MCQISALYGDFHFHQLSAAVESCLQLTITVKNKSKWDFHPTLEGGMYATFQLDSMIGGRATECHSQPALNRCQVKVLLLRPSSPGARA